MVIRFAIVAAILAFLSVPAVSAGNDYSRADLDVLAGEGSWDELLQHLKDIRPTQRDDGWRTLAEQAAIGALADSQTEGDVASTYALAEKLRKQFPVLRKSKTFVEKRAIIGLDQYGRCFQLKEKSVSDCLLGLEAFVASAGGGAAVAVEAAEVAAAHVRGEYLVPFYHRAFAAEPGAPGCAERRVTFAVSQALHKFEDEADLAPARAIAFDYCWPAVKPRLLDDFAAARLGSRFHVNSCAGLMAKQALAGMRARLCDHLAAR